ncbi:hypothetical protein C8F04DRAFT_1194603 [Mycena alexandri]|uniref:CCHC-type domain-containing protein n=1 Tax=Mycena alexandri TaxID=1745969 RepID=A0AAD6WSW3_9AGAR|nr:hypothetical protein C8F04DRAFT_1194603 [Mycena alexandri]
MFSVRAVARRVSASVQASRRLPIVRKIASDASHVRCNTCGKLGHYTVNCPEPVKYPCKLCGSTDHWAAQCPSRACIQRVSTHQLLLRLNGPSSRSMQNCATHGMLQMRSNGAYGPGVQGSCNLLMPVSIPAGAAGPPVIWQRTARCTALATDAARQVTSQARAPRETHNAFAITAANQGTCQVTARTLSAISAVNQAIPRSTARSDEVSTRGKARSSASSRSNPVFLAHLAGVF